MFSSPSASLFPLLAFLVAVTNTKLHSQRQRTVKQLQNNTRKTTKQHKQHKTPQNHNINNHKNNKNTQSSNILGKILSDRNPERSKKQPVKYEWLTRIYCIFLEWKGPNKEVSEEAHITAKKTVPNLVCFSFFSSSMLGGSSPNTLKLWKPYFYSVFCSSKSWLFKPDFFFPISGFKNGWAKKITFFELE